MPPAISARTRLGWRRLVARVPEKRLLLPSRTPSPIPQPTPASYNQRDAGRSVWGGVEAPLGED